MGSNCDTVQLKPEQLARTFDIYRFPSMHPLPLYGLASPEVDFSHLFSFYFNSVQTTVIEHLLLQRTVTSTRRQSPVWKTDSHTTNYQRQPGLITISNTDYVWWVRHEEEPSQGRLGSLWHSKEGGGGLKDEQGFNEEELSTPDKRTGKEKGGEDKLCTVRLFYK